jgi:hypothetical protein
MNANFASMLQVFLLYHTSPLNNLIHLVTTPMGLIGFISLVKSERYLIFTVYTYILFMDPSLPLDIFFINELLMLLNIFIASKINNRLVSLSLIVSGYYLQDFAHYITGEDTLQQHTWGSSLDVSMFFQHTLYLQPLVIASVYSR